MKNSYVGIRYSGILFLLLASYISYSQSRTFVQTIDTVVVCADRTTTYALGSKQVELSKSLAISPNSTEALSLLSSIYIKNYGGNSLSTISFRGTSPTQTRTSINGMNINSATTGMMDYSLLPSFLFSSTSLQYGAQSAVIGSGAIGGVIDWKSSIDTGKSKQLTVQNSIGSFHTYSGYLLYQGKFKHHQWKMQPYLLKSANDYSYWTSSPYGKERHTISNASSIQTGVFTQYQFSQKNINIQWWSWYQWANRGLISTIEVPNDGQQKDRWLKSGLIVTQLYKKSKQLIRIGVQRDKMWYSSEKSSLYSVIQPTQLSVDYELYHQLSPKMQWTTGLQYLGQWTSTANYSPSKIYLPRLSYFLSGQWKITSSLKVQISLRQEYQTRLLQPVPSIGAEYRFKRYFLVRTKYSGVYRLPTLNDLYWNPGGNKDLNPEKGGQTEVGVEWSRSTTSWEGALDCSAFYGKINDWILWQPNLGYWSAENIRKVENSGLEVSGKLFHPFSPLHKIGIQAEMGYYKTITITSSDSNTAVEGKQLIYIPPYKFSCSGLYSFQRFSLSIQLQWNSWRFTTSDNSTWLDAFTILNGQLNYDIFYNSVQRGQIQFMIQNITNTHYQLMAGRPLPLRNYTIQLTLHF